MYKEIDILLRAHFRGCLIVDKESHTLLEEEGLYSAQRGRVYEAECKLSPPGRQSEVTAPFPGCVNLAGGHESYRMMGDTPHFAIFYAGADPVPRLGV